MERLRPADREVLRLANWEALSRSDVAVALGCSENAASKRLRRALDRLASAMGVVRETRERFFTPERREA
jgi:DNA-directed RNA polymerase specialized sigma24 family protein